MNDRADDATPAERRLRALLAEEGLAVHVGGAPHAEIVQEGRRARRRSRTVLGAGLAVLVAVPAVALAAQGFQDSEARPPVAGNTSDALTPGAGGEQPPEATEPPEETPSDQPRPPSDPERQLLDGITLEEARAQLTGCLDEYMGRPAWGDDPMEVDPADLQILLAWQGHGGENQGPGPIRRVLAVSVAGDVQAELVCNKSMEETGAGSGMQSSVGLRPPERREVLGLEWRRYHTPEVGLTGDWSSHLPFRWAFFNHVDEEAVARVTVEYGGETHEALIDGGFYLTAGLLDERPDAGLRVRGYDAGGEVIFDSRDHPPID
jgi:hypothetical protein